MALSLSAAPPAQDGTRAAHARTPPGTVIYAIGDVHGRADLVRQMLQGIREDCAARSAPRTVVVFLGDYVSRGPDSRAVVDLVLDPRLPGAQIVTLKGNHEDLLWRFLQGDLRVGNHWLGYGAAQALEAYGLHAPAAPVADASSLSGLRDELERALPAAHRAFFGALRAGHREGGYYFCHAGLCPGVPLAQQSERDRIWIRQRFLTSAEDFGVMVVHGHCVSAEAEFRANRIGIDTGAFASGRLSCLVLDGAQRLLLQT